MPYHVQVAGCARSGTTLMGNLLKCFDDIVLPEKEDEVIVAKTLRNTPLPSNKRLGGKRATSFNWYIMRGVPSDLKIIWMIRDGRDVILSSHSGKKHYVNPTRWMNDNYRGLLLKYKYPEQVIVLKFEDLILKHEETMLKLSLQLDSPLTKVWEEVMGEISPTGRYVGELRGVRPIDTSVVGTWKHRHEELKGLLSKAKTRYYFSELLTALDYEPDDSWLNKIEWK